MKNLNSLMILAGLLSLRALNATGHEDSFIGSVDPKTGVTSYVTQKEYFMGILKGARQARAAGDYKEAGRTLYDLAQDKNQGGPRFIVRPGRALAAAARREFDDMKAKGQWDDSMFYRGDE